MTAEEQGLSAALEGCPFCGSTPYPVPQNDDCELPEGLKTPGGPTHYQTIWREGCGAEGGKRATEAEAITAWNTRSEGLPALVGEGVGSVAPLAAPSVASPSLANEPATPSWHSAYVEKPAPGRKIIAVYDDWSGARLFFVHDGGFIDQDGDDYDDLDNFAVWAYLPPFAKLWCELRGGDDAFTFPTDDGSQSPVASDGEASKPKARATEPKDPKDRP